MKKWLAILIFTIQMAFAPPDTVYVCANGSTVVYHVSANCSALKRCMHKVETMTKEEAIKSGKRACRVCG
jgi:hypothetical protein